MSRSGCKWSKEGKICFLRQKSDGDWFLGFSGYGAHRLSKKKQSYQRRMLCSITGANKRDIKAKYLHLMERKIHFSVTIIHHTHTSSILLQSSMNWALNCYHAHHTYWVWPPVPLLVLKYEEGLTGKHLLQIWTSSQRQTLA